MDNRQKPEDLKILVVSHNSNESEDLGELLEAKGFFVQTAADGSQALNFFEQTTFDLVFTKLMMPKLGGRDFLNRLKERFPEVFVVLLSDDATKSAELKTDQGAFNYTLKPPYQKNLFPLIKTVAEHKRFLKSNFYPQEERRKNYRFENIIGKNSRMLDILHRIQDVARANILVLITGETGTGKELVADAIHYSSPRRDGPLIKINCASLSDGLVESELFGHEKGAFTTALMQKKGNLKWRTGGPFFWTK